MPQGRPTAVGHGREAILYRPCDVSNFWSAVVFIFFVFLASPAIFIYRRRLEVGIKEIIDPLGLDVKRKIDINR